MQISLANFIIEEYKVTGIDQNLVEEDYPIAEYNINGMKSSGETGLKIVKMKSGKVLKCSEILP